MVDRLRQDFRRSAVPPQETAAGPTLRHLLVRLYGIAAIGTLVAVGLATLVGLQFGLLTVSGTSGTGSDAPQAGAEAAMRVSGQGGYFSDFIPVDPSRRYRLSARFRASSDAAGVQAASRVLLGFRMYDERRKPLAGRGRAYRYANAPGTVLSGLEGWVAVDDVVTGLSETDPKSFRPGTAFIRVVVVPGYGADAVTTEIADVRFSEMPTLRRSPPADAPQ